MPAQKKYPDELRERAVHAVFEIREREGKGHGGARPGTTADDKKKIADLEREVRNSGALMRS